MTNSLPTTEVCLLQASMMQSVNSSAYAECLRLCCSQLQSGDQQALSAVPVLSMGSEAERILRYAQTGHVLAVFKRSFYVQCNQGVFCVGLASLGRGPLNVLLDSNRDQLPIAVKSGAVVNVGYHSTHRTGCHVVGGIDLVAADDGKLYYGKVPTIAINPLSVQTMSHVFEAALRPQQQGFGWILSNADWQCQSGLPEPLRADLTALELSLRKQCFPALLCLSQWLQKSFERYDDQCLNASGIDSNMNPPKTVGFAAMTNTTSSQLPALLGAGPGLTPAGDDLLAGVILALHRVDRADLADSIWQLIEPLLIVRTNTISSAHMRLAAQGQCSEPVLLLLERVFNDPRCIQPDGAQAIAIDVQTLANRIGATSGWDTLAGMSLVLRAL